MHRLILDSYQDVVGAVIKGNNVKFIADTNEKVDSSYNAFTVEALSWRFGLNLAHMSGCNKLEINEDNIEVITTIKEGSLSFFASVIFDD